MLPSYEQLMAGRFEIRRLLGEGGMGAVYEAYDRLHDATVALKTLKTFSGDDVLRLKREFRALLDLHHPNFVRLGELCSDGQSWFFTMELVDGCDIVSHARPGQAPIPESGVRSPVGPDQATLDIAEVEQAASVSPRPLDEARLRATLAQLARALDHLHRAGRVHLDVKPSNVLVDAAGRVVLLDFGISGEAHLPRDSRQIPGTLAYMAPEQAAGAPVSGAADFYALGVVLYQALTNRLPFSGERDDVIRAKRLGPPPPILAEPVPADLLSLSLALLHAEPAMRPSCADVLRVLGQGDAPSEAVVRAPFTGRRAELAQLSDFLGASRQRGLYVCVTGEPGIGKTELVRTALARHQALYPGTRVLRGRCYAQERLPYKAWDSVIDALSELLMALRPTEVDRLRPADSGALLSLFPVLRRVLALGEARVKPAAPAELVRRGSAALVELLAALAVRTPLLLVVDDLQWADEPSQELLAELFERTSNVTVLATSRLPRLAIETRLGDVVRKLPLGGLTEPDQRELAHALLVRAPAEELAELCREAAGHPLHLVELCRHALRPGVPRTRLLESLRARVRGLAPAGRRLLELASLSDVPLPLDVLARAAGSDAAECGLHVQELCVRHLLRHELLRGARAVEPYHDRVREACEAELASEQRAALHFRLGEALLEGCDAPLRDAELPRIARHLVAGLSARADEPARRLTVTVALDAARALRRGGALANALECCETALGLCAAETFEDAAALAFELRRERLVLRALSGDEAGAEADYAALLAQAGTALARASVHATKVPLHVYRDAFEPALATANRGLSELGCPLPSAPAPADLLSAARTVLFRFDALGADKVDALPRCSDERVARALELLATVPPTAFRTGHNALGALSLLRIAQLSLEHGVTEVSPFGFAGVGMALAALSPLHGQAARCGAGAQKLAARLRDPYVAALVDMVCGGFIAPWVQPAGEARALLERSLDQFTRLGDRIHIGPVVLHIAINLQLAGRSFADVDVLEGLVPRVEASGDRGCYTTCGAALRALRFLRADEHEPAVFVADTDAAFERDIPASRPVTCRYYHAVSKGIALYFVGSFERAAAELAAADASAEAGIALPLYAEHLFYRALTACALAEQGRISRRAAAAQLAGVLPRAWIWERHCPSSFAARRRVLAAELSALRGHLRAAGVAFEEAAARARADDNHVLAALAAWRAARCLARAKAPASAAFERAAAAFERAGASGLARRILREAEQA